MSECFCKARILKSNTSFDQNDLLLGNHRDYYSRYHWVCRSILNQRMDYNNQYFQPSLYQWEHLWILNSHLWLWISLKSNMKLYFNNFLIRFNIIFSFPSSKVWALNLKFFLFLRRSWRIIILFKILLFGILLLLLQLPHSFFNIILDLG